MKRTIQAWYEATETFLTKHPYLLLFGGLLLIATLAITRRPDLFFNAQFWAEDGAVWYTDAYHKGFFATIFQPYPEYFAVPQRLMVFIASLLPFFLAPLCLNIFGLLIQLLPIGLLLGGRFRSIIPSRLFTLGLAVIYIALPNTTEVFSSFANMQWHLGLTAIFIVVGESSKRWAWRLFDALILVTAGLASPLVIFLAPIVLLRWWLTKTIDYRRNMLLVCGLALVQIFSIILSANQRTGTPPDANILAFAKIIAGQIFTGGVLGQDNIELLFGHPKALYLLLMGGALLIVYVIIKGPIWLRLLNLYSLIVVTGTLFTLKNPEGYTLDIWQGLTKQTGGQRYWYIPICIWVLTFVWLTFRAKQRLVRVIGTTLTVLLITIGIPQNWRLSPMQDFHFQQYAKKFELAPRTQPFTLPINPAGWKMTLYKK